MYLHENSSVSKRRLNNSYRHVEGVNAAGFMVRMYETPEQLKNPLLNHSWNRKAISLKPEVSSKSNHSPLQRSSHHIPGLYHVTVQSNMTGCICEKANSGC